MQILSLSLTSYTSVPYGIGPQLAQIYSFNYTNTCILSTEKLLMFVLDQQMPLLPGMVDGLGSHLLQRRQLYAGPMSKLRLLMICRMAKPEEVLIVEDENGNIVRETLKDNDVLVQYKVFILTSCQKNQIIKQIKV